MRHQGKITTWRDDKGFGFITPDNGGKQVFLHASAFSDRRRRPEENDPVTYGIAVSGDGRSQAKAVTFVGERPISSASPSRNIVALVRDAVALVFAACFLLLVVTAASRGRIPATVAGLYLVASVIAFFAYGFDKSAAMRNQWRTRESTLHLFSLFGGWPGALAAQRLFRHKSAKLSFQVTFWITVVLNCGVLGWLSSPSGTQAFHSATSQIWRLMPEHAPAERAPMIRWTNKPGPGAPRR
ncbi:MAG: cold shock and DUF1294 domain-containing protein [Candidatus Accumulibacter sp.]|jgi:uncharacterized membrane protein YsdA (DUF1294 family)/cold shock CspA family protein|nr:cold shock and DUF1294 domain-containing protein [Accumulibacter sp.]